MLQRICSSFHMVTWVHLTAALLWRESKRHQHALYNTKGIRSSDASWKTDATPTQGWGIGPTILKRWVWGSRMSWDFIRFPPCLWTSAKGQRVVHITPKMVYTFWGACQSFLAPPWPLAEVSRQGEAYKIFRRGEVNHSTRKGNHMVWFTDTTYQGLHMSKIILCVLCLMGKTTSRILLTGPD